MIIVKKIRIIKILDGKITDDSDPIEHQKEEKKKEEAEVNFTISFAGDCTLGNYAGQAYDGSFNQEYKRQGNDPTYFLKKVKK